MIKCFEIVPKNIPADIVNNMWKLMGGEGEFKFTRNKIYIAKIGNKDDRVVIINDKGGSCKIPYKKPYRFKHDNPMFSLKDFFEIDKTFYVKNNKEFNNRKDLLLVSKLVDPTMRDLVISNQRLSLFSPTFDLFEVDINDDTELKTGDLIRYKNGKAVRQIINNDGKNYVTEDYTGCYGHCRLYTINDLKTQFKLQRFVEIDKENPTTVPIPDILVNSQNHINTTEPIYVIHDKSKTVFRYKYCAEEAGYGCISDKVYLSLPDDVNMSIHAFEFKENFSMIVNYKINQY